MRKFVAFHRVENKTVFGSRVVEVTMYDYGTHFQLWIEGEGRGYGVRQIRTGTEKYIRKLFREYQNRS